MIQLIPRRIFHLHALFCLLWSGYNLPHSVLKLTAGLQKVYHVLADWLTNQTTGCCADSRGGQESQYQEEEGQEAWEISRVERTARKALEGEGNCGPCGHWKLQAWIQQIQKTCERAESKQQLRCCTAQNNLPTSSQACGRRAHSVSHAVKHLQMVWTLAIIPLLNDLHYLTMALNAVTQPYPSQPLCSSKECGLLMSSLHTRQPIFICAPLLVKPVSKAHQSPSDVLLCLQESAEDSSLQKTSSNTSDTLTRLKSSWYELSLSFFTLSFTYHFSHQGLLLHWDFSGATHCRSLSKNLIDE